MCAKTVFLGSYAKWVCGLMCQSVSGLIVLLHLPFYNLKRKEKLEHNLFINFE